MRRIARVMVLVLIVAVCGLTVPDAFAGGGMSGGPPDKTVGPMLIVSVVMEGPKQPSEPTLRQFSMTVRRGHLSEAALFTGGLNYLYGCMQPGFPSLQASTEQRFLGFLSTWAPIDVLDAIIGPFGSSDRAALITVDDVLCTSVGDKEYLSFTGRVRFAR